ncbi:TetR/AcrR family transcriptional regulator [Paraburkholderia madseniana]|uniref:TetR/AcrR family transcriptional regulator n=1 Tax=Paraburkholderia madseniana TaxID=2599607 RepID=A0AAP5BKF4_9BURK|nr:MULTISPECIES: TetR/AcrR family transcriptional regulator [Paraburkholderia]MCX4150187.1 TetR/AcrR family transcriptional regulator [Paraburkholderia madseniana]MDN7153123.1 TetR/AcrR family transcriptional regulator [Paraburkholderia sp. WS6]MDQ6412005.1 TetR/AcrR family transcriptional regulator [Paraburkholderia madseniana]
MKRQRLTREQSKDQTRQRLLDAGQAIFMKKGFVAASVEDIAGAAGYTRGAFYSNFRSKNELFLELLRRDHEAMQAGLQTIFENAATREEMEERVLRYYSSLHRENKCFLLWVEAKLLAVRDGRFRIRFNAFMHEKLEQMSEYIREFSTRVGTPLPLPAETLAMGLMGLCDGVQFFYTVDPQNVSSEMAETVLAGFFARVVFGRDA